MANREGSGCEVGPLCGAPAVFEDEPFAGESRQEPAVECSDCAVSDRYRTVGKAAVEQEREERLRRALLTRFEEPDQRLGVLMVPPRQRACCRDVGDGHGRRSSWGKVNQECRETPMFA